MKLLINLLIKTLAVYLAGLILPGVTAEGFVPSLLAAIVLGIINTFVKPILTILTLPLTILTLGIFYIILNALLILLVSQLVTGFEVDGILWALLFGLVLSIINSFLESLTK